MRIWESIATEQGRHHLRFNDRGIATGAHVSAGYAGLLPSQNCLRDGCNALTDATTITKFSYCFTSGGLITEWRLKGGVVSTVNTQWM